MSRPPRKDGKTARPPKGQTDLPGGEGALPTKAQVMAFIEQSPGKVGKREIAKAFGVKGGGKIGLKRLLAEMGEEGALAGNRKELHAPGSLPPVTTLDITGRDGDGDLIGEPTVWEHDEGERPKVLITHARDVPGEPAYGVGDRVLAKVRRVNGEASGDIGFEGSIVKRLPREKRRLLGIYRAAKGGGGSIEPIDRKELRAWPIHKGDEGSARDGDLVRYDLARKGRVATPQARVVEALGNPSDQRQISLIAIHSHGIPDDFPESVIVESESLTPPTLEGRTDLRKLPLITIDPADARDHDDAVHAAPDPDPKNPDGFILHVAIADVAHYVRPGTKLDREAQLRGNSVYFPDRVVPMLPERISNDLCSLREGQDRSVLVARMVFDAHGDKRGHTFVRAMMRSAAKLSYQEAQAAIDGQPTQKCLAILETVLKPLWAAYAKLAAARDRREPLDLDLPERKIRLDETGRVCRVEVPERLAAHRLIEECMIQANVAAAEALEARKGGVVYRIHDQPSKEKLKGLKDFLDTLDLKLPPAGELKPGALNKILAQAKTLPVPDLINEVVLRSQSQAEYNPDNIGHFGLNLKKYAHFTSPIRRYADLLVHRALIRTLKLGAGGMEDAEVPKLRAIAQAISQTERRAMAAERETTDRLIAAHLADHVGATFVARVAGVTRSGLFVRLKDSGADGFIPISSLGDEYFNHVEESHALVGSRSGLGYRLGDVVDVKLLEAIPSAGALRFAMVTPPVKLALRSGRAPGKPFQGGKGPRRMPRQKLPRR
jgi:ribonuclease R